MSSDASVDLAASRRSVAPLDPTFVNFLRADFHRGAYDVWLTVADRPLEEGIETLSKFFEGKEKAILVAYSEAMDGDEDEDEDEVEAEELLVKMPEERKDILCKLFIAKEAEMSSAVQHYAEDEEIGVETGKLFEDKEKGILCACSEAMVGDKDEEEDEELFIAEEAEMCSAVQHYAEDEAIGVETGKEAEMSSDVEHYAEDEVMAVATGKLLAREKKHARNEHVDISVKGGQEGKKARIEESVLHTKGECGVSGETKSFV